jgi:hypothetical protein
MLQQLSSLVCSDLFRALIPASLPGPANSLVAPGGYSVTVHDRDLQTPTSIFLDLRTPDGQHMGTIQCFFPLATSAASIAFGRWTAIVGRNLTLEVRP